MNIDDFADTDESPQPTGWFGKLQLNVRRCEKCLENFIGKQPALRREANEVAALFNQLVCHQARDRGAQFF
jgi:hypothetical protein